MTNNFIEKEIEKEVKVILALPFLSPPLDIFKIGDIRPKLEKQTEMILELMAKEKKRLIAEIRKDMPGAYIEGNNCVLRADLENCDDVIAESWNRGSNSYRTRVLKLLDKYSQD